MDRFVFCAVFFALGCESVEQADLDGEGATPEDVAAAVKGVIDEDPDSVPQVVIDVAKGLVDDAFTRYTEGTAVGTIFQAGGDIYQMLSALELLSILRFTEEPAASGTFPAGTVTERWDALAIEWTVGACAGREADDECGRHEWSFQTLGMEPILANPTASVASHYDLTVEPHGVTFKYGTLVLYIFEHLILPMAVGYESFDNFIYEMLGGDGCAVENPGTESESCCRPFSVAVTEEDGMTRDIAYQLCVNGVPAVLEQVKGWVTGLDVATGENLQIGTKDATSGESTPCRLHDDDLNNVVEGLGTEKSGERCKWYFELDVGAANPVKFPGAWHGTRQ